MSSINLEYTAEDLISHKLQRASILIAKPKFDIEGTDLIAFIKFKDAIKFGRIQSKGRTLSTGTTSIEVPVEYVYGAFFLFIYFDIGIDNTNLYFYTANDICQYWVKSKNGKKYRLSVKAKSIAENKIISDQIDFLFTDDKIDRIKKIIETSQSETEILMMQIIKIQQKLSQKKDDKNEFEKIITEYRHQKEKLAIINESLVHYENELNSFLTSKVELIPSELKDEVLEYHRKKNCIDSVIKKYDNRLSKFIEKEIIVNIVNFLIYGKISSIT